MKLGVLILLVLSTVGCATVNIPRIGTQDYTVYDDERRMLKRAEEASERLNASRLIYQDSNLEAYLNKLIETLLASDIKSTGLNIRVKILRDPSLNAFALPNGWFYVHAGLLAAIDNEAQLATILAHEASHIIHRHSLKEFRSLINKSAFFATLQVPTAAFVGELGVLLTELAVVSSIYGFSQDLEREADREGFKMIVARGYDVREATKIFEHLKEFIKDEEIKQPFFFSTHPRVLERIQSFEELIKKTMPSYEYESGAPTNAEAYQRFIKQLISEDVSLCLQYGMFKTGKRLIDKYLQMYPREAKGHFLRGELFRQRQDKGKKEKKREKSEDYVKAIKAYEQALKIRPLYPEALRAKAIVLQKQDKIEEVKQLFKEYLELAPQAQDREYIEQFLATH